MTFVYFLPPPPPPSQPLLQKKLPLTALSQTMQEGGGQLGDETLIG